MSHKTVELHLDIGTACYLLGGMSRRWIKDKIKDGELVGYELAGNKIVVTAESVNAYLARHRIGPSTP
jgi:hypothetical protein